MTSGNGKKHRFISFLFGFLFAALLGTGLYYINEVRIARRDTQAIFDSALVLYGTKVRPSDLSPERKKVLLDVEDPKFYTHHGVDLETPGAGMTTLTQGLVKLLYFPDGFRPGIAKFRQTLIAHYALDALISKDDQLLLFLNMCYFGHENGRAIHGFADAAETYYGEEFSTLTDDEFLSLVAMIIGPNAYKPGTPAHAERVKRIRAYLSGQYRPAAVLDTDYDGTQRGSLADELCMAILRLLTDAKPE
jgi:membrane peptidoglycan carboxypeptidase